MISLAEMALWRSDVRLLDLEARLRDLPALAKRLAADVDAATDERQAAHSTLVELRTRAEIGDPAISKLMVAEATKRAEAAQTRLDTARLDLSNLSVRKDALDRALRQRGAELLDTLAQQIAAEAEPLAYEIAAVLAPLAPKIRRLQALERTCEAIFDSNQPGCRGFSGHLGRRLPFGTLAEAIGPLPDRLRQALDHMRPQDMPKLPTVTP